MNVPVAHDEGGHPAQTPAPQTTSTTSGATVAQAGDAADDTTPRRRLWRWRRAVADDPTVIGWRQETLLVLGALFRGDGTGYAGQGDLGRRLGCSERTVRRRLDWAMEAGWIARTKRGHRLGNGGRVGSEYAVMFPVNRTPGLPVEPVEEDEVNRKAGCPVDDADDGGLNRNPRASQPDTSCVSTGKPGVRPGVSLSRTIHGGTPLRGLNALGLGKDPDADTRYAAAYKRCLDTPDFGVAAQERARAELGDDASARAVVIHAAELLDHDTATGQEQR